MRRHTSGFTLFEMAIVLTIIALIVGGIVLGQNMLRQANLRAVMTDVDKFIKATKQFQDKYASLPGDMANATNFWGVDPNGCPGAYTTTPTTATCNGDGNGRIATFGTAGTYPEVYRAWQQLADAGFIEGTYTGATGSTVGDLVVPGYNAPSRATGGYTLVSLIGADTANPNDYFTSDWAHAIIYGSTSLPVYPAFTTGPQLAVDEAYSIDAKIDDSLPGTGKVMTFKNSSIYSGGCASTSLPTTAVYNVTGVLAGAPACELIFKTGF